VERLIINGLLILFPQFNSISLEVGVMPTESQQDVVLCCEAAFTDRLLDEFTHDNINGHHVCDGEYFLGSPSSLWSDNSGCFVYTPEGGCLFSSSPELDVRRAEDVKGGMAFMQHLIILDGKYQDVKWSRKPEDINTYRALCRFEGKICIIQSESPIRYDEFEKSLVDLGVSDALYLDMGARWNYAWYRNSDGSVGYLFEENKSINTYTTNWITFRKSSK